MPEQRRGTFREAMDRADRLADEAIAAMEGGDWKRGRRLMLEANQIRRDAYEQKWSRVPFSSRGPSVGHQEGT